MRHRGPFGIVSSRSHVNPGRDQIGMFCWLAVAHGTDSLAPGSAFASWRMCGARRTRNSKYASPGCRRHAAVRPVPRGSGGRSRRLSATSMRRFPAAYSLDADGRRILQLGGESVSMSEASGSPNVDGDVQVEWRCTGHTKAAAGGADATPYSFVFLGTAEQAGALVSKDELVADARPPGARSRTDFSARSIVAGPRREHTRAASGTLRRRQLDTYRTRARITPGRKDPLQHPLPIGTDMRVLVCPGFVLEDRRLQFSRETRRASIFPAPAPLSDRPTFLRSWRTKCHAVLPSTRSLWAGGESILPHRQTAAQTLLSFRHQPGTRQGRPDRQCPRSRGRSTNSTSRVRLHPASTPAANTSGAGQPVELARASHGTATIARQRNRSASPPTRAGSGTRSVTCC